jgi:alkylation response protein AidB-like acyl-CoA dehydrogenase
MDFALTEDQRLIQNAAREFPQQGIAPVAAQFDASGEFPGDTLRRAGELGFMRMGVPEDYGGVGFDAVFYAIVRDKEIAAADAAPSAIVSVNNSLYWNGILSFGTEAQKARFVTRVASGRAIGCYGLPEP